MDVTRSPVHLLDTNMVSYIVKGRSPAARRKLLSLQGNDIPCISAVTEAEIRYGLAKRPQAIALKALMEGFLANIQVLPWDRNEADVYGSLRAKLEAAGKTLGSMDLMIAAHAVSTAAFLVTNDRALSQVEDLHGSVNWATEI